MPCGIGTEEIQSVLFGYSSLAYPGLLSVFLFSITGPHPACIKAKEQKDRVDFIPYNCLFPLTLKNPIGGLVN